MAAICEMQLIFDQMSTYFEAWHDEKLGKDGAQTLERLVRNWNNYECEAPCPLPGMCSFATTSSAVGHYGWDSYFALFAACGDQLRDGGSLTEIPVNTNNSSSDLMDHSYLRQPGHFGK